MDRLLKRFKEFTQKNNDKVPQISVIPIERKNRFQYVGGQIAEGKLYSVPNSAETMLCYDVGNGMVDFLGEFSDKDFKWTGGCIYKDVFYSFPRTENCLLAFDTRTKNFDKIPCNQIYESEHHYGGVCTAEGVIYQPPRNSNHILKWDIEKKISEKIIVNNGEVCRYCAAVLHPDGYVYFIPEWDCRVLKLDLKTEEITPIGDVIYGYAFDPRVAPDGNIYGFRSGDSTGGILKIDTKEDTVSVIHEETLISAYGTKMGINGKIYSLPGYNGDIWEFDWETEKLNLIKNLDTKFDVYYAGGAVDKYGNIYGLPVWADNLLKLDFKTDSEIPDDIYRTFFVDFY